MRLRIPIDGLEQVQQELRFSARRMNAAAATALTRTAAKVRDDLRESMSSTLDRPTPYTLGALGMQGATASNLEAQVFLKDDRAGSGTPATKYLLPQVEGGKRSAKRFERALQLAGHLPSGWFVTPGEGARLDAYGNISKGQIIQVLSQLRITLTAGFTRNLSFDPKKQRAAVKKAGGRFFVIKPGTKGAAPGVYIRDLHQRTITPIFKFVQRAGYQKRFNFYAVANQVSEARLQQNIELAIKQSLGRLRDRGG